MAELYTFRYGSEYRQIGHDIPGDELQNFTELFTNILKLIFRPGVSVIIVAQSKPGRKEGSSMWDID